MIECKHILYEYPCLIQVVSPEDDPCKIDDEQCVYSS